MNDHTTTPQCPFGCGPALGMHVWTNHTMSNYRPEPD